jgi:plasmid stabilization system protein ParE
MSDRFVLTPDALADLEQIWLDVAERFDLGLADRVIDKITDSFLLLADHPEAGHYREDLAARPLRFWPVGPSLVCYNPSHKPIQILFVRRAAMDWPRFL